MLRKKTLGSLAFGLLATGNEKFATERNYLVRINLFSRVTRNR